MSLLLISVVSDKNVCKLNGSAYFFCNNTALCFEDEIKRDCEDRVFLKVQTYCDESERVNNVQCIVSATNWMDSEEC